MMNIVSPAARLLVFFSSLLLIFDLLSPFTLAQDVYHHHHFDDGSKSITHHEAPRHPHHHSSSHRSPFHHSPHSHHSNHHALSLITSLLSFARNILNHSPGSHISLFKAPVPDELYSDASKVPHYFHYHEHMDLSPEEPQYTGHQDHKYEDEDQAGGGHQVEHHHGDSEHHDHSNKQEHTEYTHTDDSDSDDHGHYASNIVHNNHMPHDDDDQGIRNDYLNSILASVKASRVNISPVNDTKHSEDKKESPSSSSSTESPDRGVHDTPRFLPLAKVRQVGQVIQDKPRPDYYINYYKAKQDNTVKGETGKSNDTNHRETGKSQETLTSHSRHQVQLQMQQHPQQLPSPSVYEEESPPSLKSLVSLMHQRTPIQTDQLPSRFESSRINTLYPTRARVNHHLKRGNYSSSHNASITHSSFTSG